jgi:hypothetical protein
MTLGVPLLLFGLGMGTASAIDDVYEAPEAFLAEAFGASPPAPQLLQLDDAMQAKVSAVFGRAYPQARIRYWRANGKSAWIIDDNGKEGYQPTTAGFVVKGGEIDIARVLIYRESRGEQVTQASFLKQFTGAKAASDGLDKNIDGISGATYSVKMMQRMARTVLTLDTLAP